MRADPLRWQLLDLVHALNLPDAWIAAGFVRNTVWDHLHGNPPSPPATDIDVIWFDPMRSDPSIDTAFEATLRAQHRGVAWSVKNQARMHHRNGDPPYGSAIDAMRFWTETATAVAVRRTGDDRCDVAAPLGLHDLFALVVRPTRGQGEKHAIFEQRLRDKAWLTTWPRLRPAPFTPAPC